MKRRLRNSTPRKKNFWGGVVGGLIGAVGSVLGSAKSSSDTLKGAQITADATIKSAKEEVKAIETQTQSNEKLHKESIALSKQQHTDDINLERNLQMTLQMQAGNQSTINRQRASKVNFKYGGILRDNRSPFYGGEKPFIETDGGYAKLIEQVPDATRVAPINVYELIGDDHKHSHKSKNGKPQTGVGIKFPNGKIVEGEGNQNTNLGELVAVKGKNAIFLSKHTNKGFNPARAVKYGGMHPIIAGIIQESLKGKRFSSPVKNGRKKALSGLEWGMIGSAGLSTLGNIVGGIIGSNGAKKAAEIIANADMVRASKLADAYRNLKTIDINEAIKDSDFEAATVMPAIVNPYISNKAEIENINRTARRRNRYIRRTFLSSADAANKMAQVDADAAAQRAISDERVRNENERYQVENAKIITDAAKQTATLEQQANQAKTNAKLNLLQQKYQIENQRDLGIASALASGMTSAANARAQGIAAAGQSWGNAISGIAQSIGNTVNSVAATRQSYQDNLAKATTEGKLQLAMANNDYKTIKSLIDSKSLTGTQEIGAMKLYNKHVGYNYYDVNRLQNFEKENSVNVSTPLYPSFANVRPSYYASWYPYN